MPDVGLALGEGLRSLGLSRGEFSPESVISAAGRLDLECPFEFVAVGDASLLSNAREALAFRDAEPLLRRKTSELGCINIYRLASELGLNEDDVPRLRRALSYSSGVVWLDESHEWLYSSEPARNRLINLCSKVLGVAPRLYLSELRRAVSKSRRLPMCPPQQILGALVERTGLAKVDSSIVVVNAGKATPPSEGTAEAGMLRVLDDFGPALDGEDFAEKCVSAGLSPITYYIYRVASPVICALGKGIYCKVGANIPPGTVEDIVRNRRMTKRISDHGWTSTGRLWCGIELSRMVITAGSIGLPAFVSGLSQGEWFVLLPDGTQAGTVQCRDSFIWSFNKQFRALGAEPNDFAVFEFDLKKRQVIVKVGGPDLLEAIQDPDGSALDEAIDDA